MRHATKGSADEAAARWTFESVATAARQAASLASLLVSATSVDIATVVLAVPNMSVMTVVGHIVKTVTLKRTLKQSSAKTSVVRRSFASIVQSPQMPV